MKMNVTKKGALFKGILCGLFALGCAFARPLGFAEPGEYWFIAGAVIGGISTIGYLKKCFER